MVLKIRCDSSFWVSLSYGGLWNLFTENPRVGGSIPPLATILLKDLRQLILLPFFAMCHFRVT
jgi:hypothetical protein